MTATVSVREKTLFGMQTIRVRPRPKPEPPPQFKIPLEPVASQVLRAMVEFFDSADLSDSTPQALAIRFLRENAGTVIRVPQAGAIEQLIREISIERSVRRDPSEANVRNLADYHGLATRSVAKTFTRRTGLGVAAERERRQRESMACRAVRSSRHPRFVRARVSV